MQKRNVLNSPRLLELKKNRKKAVWSKILISFFGLVAIFIFLAYLSRLNNLNISEIAILGNKTVDTADIREIVEKEMAGKYFLLFPKSNVLIYPKTDIKNILAEKFLRLKDIQLSTENTRTLTISVDEREAKYLWCGAKISEKTDCYFLDASGFIFDGAPFYSGNVYLKFYGDSSDVGRPETGRPTSEVLGSSFAPEKFAQLVSFKDLLVEMKLQPTALYIKENGDVEIRLTKGTSGNEPKILFNINSDFQNVAENLDAALNTEPLKTKFKDKYSLLQYIDLRFGNKVYSKFNE